MYCVLRIMVTTIAVGLLLSGCKKETAAPKYHPATVEEIGKTGLMKVTLDARAAERTGLQTTQVREETVTLHGKPALRKVMPYGALMYDTKGGTWVYTSPEPLVFVRQAVTVEDVEGDQVILAEGPPAGTTIVTVGAAELMGAEHKYGH